MKIQICYFCLFFFLVCVNSAFQERDEKYGEYRYKSIYGKGDYGKAVDVKPSIPVCDDKSYYWKDYCGKIPSDAVSISCGSGKLKKNIYIGQTFFPDYGVLVSTIKDGDSNAYAIAKKKQISSSVNTKILCSSSSSILSWKKVNIKTADSEKFQFIKGGCTNGIDLKIGKITIDGETLIGNVFPKENSDCNGLEVWSKNKVTSKIQDFEMLGYC